jgi:hypothetical protein
VIPLREVVDAVVAALRAEWPDVGSGHRVGDHKTPADTTFPYAIVYAEPGGGFDGTGANAFEDATVLVRINCTGGVEKPGQEGARAQAQLLADRFRALMVEHAADGSFATPLSGDGWTVAWREPTPGGALPDAHLVTVSDDYRL